MPRSVSQRQLHSAKENNMSWVGGLRLTVAQVGLELVALLLKLFVEQLHLGRVRLRHRCHPTPIPVSVSHTRSRRQPPTMGKVAWPTSRAHTATSRAHIASASA